MSKNFRKWLACSVAITIALYNAPYSVEALEVIGNSVQLEENNEIRGNIGNVNQIEEETEDTTEQDQTDTESMTQVGDCFKVSGIKDTDWTFDDSKVLTIKAGENKDITIEGIKESGNDRIEVEEGFSGKITIKDLKINVSGKRYTGAFQFEGKDENKDITLELEGENILVSGQDRAGLKYQNTKGTLTIQGDGTLVATGGDHASGIGGVSEKNGGNITIAGGTVTATGGGNGAAGIGGGGSLFNAMGYENSGGNVTISGGIVTAKGGYYGAGIGGGKGNGGNGGNVTISGGTVTAIGGEHASGIGGGKSGKGGNVTISGGTVTAEGGEEAAGIGGGRYGNGGDVTISGGTVTAEGGNGAAGIGDGKNGDGVEGSVTISGGSIKASSMTNTPVDGNGNQVYLVKLEEQDNVTSVYVGGKNYNVSQPNDDNALYLYMSPTNHTIKTNNGEYEVRWSDGEFDIIKSYSISIDNKSLDFGVKNEGYSTDNLSKNITITNNGIKKVRLKNLNNNTEYDIKLPENEELEPNDSATITITPREGLSSGEYNKKITIETDPYATAEVDVKFKVNEELNVSLSANNTSTTGDQEITLTASATGGSGSYTYKWYVNDNEDKSLTGNVVTVSPKQTTTYKVEVSDGIETKTATVTVNVPSVPSIPSIPDEKPGIGIDIVEKISGEDRYDTSIKISQKAFPSKSEKVYLVTGEKFPDALSSAALTGKGDGPILLINDKNIDKILAEIDRLDAKEIVFVGGNSISVANKEKVEKFAKENSSVVDAFVGGDRYETAIKVAEETIEKYGNKGKVIIADGRNYPDAVSIASYAAQEGIPVILVNGNKVPDVAKNFLNKYKISNAIIVGGDKAVGKDVEKLFKSVDRVAGEDRYETSKKIADKFFADSKTVFMASGEDFADSISVSYYAGMEKAPVLLTKSNSLDDNTKEYLNSNKSKDYVIVGGDEAINPDIFK